MAIITGCLSEICILTVGFTYSHRDQYGEYEKMSDYLSGCVFKVEMGVRRPWGNFCLKETILSVPFSQEMPQRSAGQMRCGGGGGVRVTLIRRVSTMGEMLSAFWGLYPLECCPRGPFLAQRTPPWCQRLARLGMAVPTDHNGAALVVLADLLADDDGDGEGATAPP